MSEFIVIQVGQCGNQIGSCLLSEILLEYGVKTTNDVSNRKFKDDKNLQSFMKSFFRFESNNGKAFQVLGDLIQAKAKARFLCVDMEDSVVARCRTGIFQDLYDKKCLITNYPGSGNNWAEGHCNHGPKYQQKILKALQYMLEKCDNVHGFLLLFSMGGGTGSGLGSFIVKLLAEHYPNIERFVVCVYPTGTEDVITCPYNMAFATQQLLNHATCVFPVENRALLGIASRATRRYSNLGAEAPFGPFEDLNEIIVNLVLHLTSGCRFGGQLNIDMNDINTNMVPFPKLNFLCSGLSPLACKIGDANKRCLKNELSWTAFHRNNQLIKVDPLNSRYTTMAVFLLGRGKFSVNDLRTYIDKLKEKTKFAPWSRKAVKVGLCDIPPKDLDYSMFSISNTTANSGLFEDIREQFMKLYRRKAHVHHYTEVSGFDVQNFNECHNSINEIVQLYKDIEG